MESPKNKYSSFSIYLHWITAFCVIALLVTGWILHYELIDTKQLVFQLYQWHKSIGIVILLIVPIRILWRMLKPAPKLPQRLEKESTLIHLGHLALYALLIIMPVSGWLLVSSNPQGIPTIVFNYIDWWHLPVPEFVFSPSKSIHYYAALGISALFLGHVFMALRHQTQGIPLLQRMQPLGLVKIGVLLFVFVILMLSLNVFKSPIAQTQVVDSQKGQIQFFGTHTDNPFSGVFSQWQLNTDLNLQSRTMSEFSLSVDMQSASTGNTLYDGTLQESDWFDTTNHPKALYEAKSIEFLENNQIALVGVFTFKGRAMPLNIQLIINANDTISSEFILKRDRLNLGQTADSDATWVSNDISVKATIKL